MKTQKQAVAYLKTMVGKQWDYDGVFGAQCFDLANYYWYYVTGKSFEGYSAKEIPFIDHNHKGYATVYNNTKNFLAQPGDVVVFNGNYGGGHGHVAVVEKADLNNITVIEQNWLGGGMNANYGLGWEVATRRIHTYDFPMWFIRPHYKKETIIDKVKPKPVAKTTTKTTAKGKKIVLVAGHGYNDPGAVGNGTNERDFIRKNIVDNVAKYLKQAGHTVVIYNKNQDMYQDTAYGYRLGNTKDYGLYWVKAKHKPDAVIEFHLDAASSSASGGHVIKSKYAADSIDKGIDKALRSTVGTIRGITTRTDLLNVNVSYDMNINYRLVELGFITSKKDMDYIKKNLQTFTKKIAEGIHGKAIGGAPASKKKKITWNWKGRFTASSTIKVRKTAGLKGKEVDKGSWIYKNQWIDFVSVTKKDGYWWCRFRYPTNPKAGDFYCAIAKITDKEEKLKKEKARFGKIVWK